MTETLRRFNWRERQYTVPLDRSLEEAVKAAAKAWRNPDRFTLSARGADATSGRVLPLATAFVLDVSDMIDRLPEPQRTAVHLYYRVARPVWRRDHDETECRSTCQAHYGNPQIASYLLCRGWPMTARQVGELKREAVARIVARLWPAEVRRHKRRTMRV